MKKSDLKLFFSERLIEMLDLNTPDSYRVRNNNSLSLLSELSGLINGWSSNRIKQFETVQLGIDETVSSLKNDLVFDSSSYNKDLFYKDLSSYSEIAKSKEMKDDKVTISATLINASKQIQFIIDQYLIDNKSSYVNNSFKFIESIIESEDELIDKDYSKVVGDLNKVIGGLACQLIHDGHSKTRLYSLAQPLLKCFDDFDNQYKAFKNHIVNGKKNKYTIVYRIPTNKYIETNATSFSLTDNVDDLLTDVKTMKTDCRKYLTPTSGVHFLRSDYEAYDAYFAIKESHESISRILDYLSFGIRNRKIIIPEYVAIITYKEENSFGVLKETDYRLDGALVDNIDISTNLRKQCDLIFNNSSIDRDVKDRISSALRHIRFGNNALEMEQKFINYWIALEFIFSSPITNENTYGRLKKHLTNLLCSCYIKRNVMYLNDALKNSKSLTDKDILWEMSDKEWGALITPEKSLLRQYRLCCLKSHLHNASSIESYIIQHKTNLEQHFSRIYRMRNELVHDAAINQDIEAVTSNLRYYLSFLITQMVGFFVTIPINGRTYGINDFFYKYDSKMKEIETNWDREAVLSVKFTPCVN